MPRIKLALASTGLALAAVLIWAGLTASNSPINRPIAGRNAAIAAPVPTGRDDALWIGLGFSGGGTRASAFGQGMIQEIRAMTATPTDPDGLLSEVRLVTGVSGGSVTAAWFGLTGPAGVDRFPDLYLRRNAETYMSMSPWNPLTLARILGGGGNGRATFARFLNEELFNGATFGDLARR